MTMSIKLNYRHRRHLFSRKQRGFMMPSILIIIGVLAMLGFSTMAAVSTSQLAALKQTYLQMAHVASKAAFDWAKEQYEADPNYNGTPETDLLTTSLYRITFEVEVLSTSGNVKNIRGIGRVYIPEESSTASFVRDIKGGIIRDGITIGNPADYNPLLWLDASVSSSLIKTTGSNNTQFITAPSGNANASVVEERGSDARRSPGKLDWGGDDLEMAWDGTNRGTQTIGLRFPGVNIPQGATVTNAYIQFTTDETKRAGNITLIIEGVDEDNFAGFSGTYGVSNTTKTSANVSWSPVDWNIVGSAGQNERTDSLTAIVQEIVNRSGWNPGNAMAFSIKPDPNFIGIGFGIRTAGKGKSGDTPAPVLFVEWDTGGGAGSGSQFAGNGDGVAKWLDQSGNGNDAVLATYSGVTAPVKRDSQLNSKPIVEFRAANKNLLLSSLSPATQGNALTAFMVLKPLTSTPNLGRFLSAMNSAKTDDYNTADGMVVFYRSDTTGTLSMRTYYNYTGTESVSGAIDDKYAIYSTRVSSTYVERLRKNGSDNYSSTVGSLNYTIDQILIGGRRSGNSAFDLSDSDIAEVIVYDHDLKCSEIYSVELYLASKWGVSLNADAGCP